MNSKALIGKKVKAFTIIEMTVVMLLSTIVISMAYFAFELLSKRYVKYKAQTEVYYKLTLLDQLLSKDFFTADSIKAYGGNLRTFQGEVISDYEFVGHYILRRAANQTDTFYFQVVKHELLYQEMPVSSDELIDQCKLNLLFENRNLEYVYSKQDGSANSINKTLRDLR
jgi:hypothetical protein